ncbi:uncharacterized protein LOC124459119 [Xenia sp. Carnegie-2017]|uniref:uncharacterized protein LOC124459119 n=1 Tax=Xenia sp. Carnegie-2017 TaxID=2897299 RepID=UPI001F0354F8|nr:uncharacterized protein LOC124459119 [Xenia sp. Carnegie-2017]
MCPTIDIESVQVLRESGKVTGLLFKLVGEGNSFGTLPDLNKKVVERTVSFGDTCQLKIRCVSILPIHTNLINQIDPSISSTNFTLGVGELDVKFETSGQNFSWYCGSSRREVVLDKPANKARVYYRKNEDVEIFIEDCPQVKSKKFSVTAGKSVCYDESFSYACPGIEGKHHPCSYELTINKKTTKVSQVSVGLTLKIVAKFKISFSASRTQKIVHTYEYQEKWYFVVPAGYTFCSYRKATISFGNQSYYCSGTDFKFVKFGTICSGNRLCNKKERSCFHDEHNISNRPNFHFAFCFIILCVFLFI